MKQNPLVLISFFIVMILFYGCAGKHVKVQADDSLALCSCFPLPNCVSSNAWLFYNNVSPFELAVDRKTAWPVVKQAVADIPRAKIVEEDLRYIHAKCYSRVFHFVDNLELLMHPDEDIISVRSSSFIAIFDFGVNHWRVYKLRKQLIEKGVIKE